MDSTTSANHYFPEISTAKLSLEIVKPAHREPPIATTSSSRAYLEACARSNQVAVIKDPLTLLFEAEKLAPLPNEPPLPTSQESPITRQACDILWKRLSHHNQSDIQRLIYNASIGRLTVKCKPNDENIKDGGRAFIAEAGNFAAVTCWEPMYAPDPPPNWEAICNPQASDQDLTGLLEGFESNGTPMEKIVGERPVFAKFRTGLEFACYRYLYPVIWRRAESRGLLGKVSTNGDASQAPNGVTSEDKRKHLKYWYICLTSRNPAIQPPVPGAIRAVIEPILKKFTEEEDIPAIWICAGNPRARDVYGYFGFRVVQEVIVGTDREGTQITSWCMIYTRDGQVAKEA